MILRFMAALLCCLVYSAPATAALHKHNHKHSRGGATASINCVVPELRDLIRQVQAKFGPVQVISTCRPGAKIRGTGRPSLHASGRAVDFRTKNKRAVVAWLRKQKTWGTMVYRKKDHIHVDYGRGAYYAVGNY